MQPAARPARFGEVFAVSEFRALWLAQLQSVTGDQLARVALTVLVYERTHSPLLTALTYAATYVPWVIGGLALSSLADRLPRRAVMITCDLARAVLVAVMILPGMYVVAMVCLVAVVTLLDAPFKSARAALLADVLSGDRYVLGSAVTQLTIQSGTVAGFALGGIVTGFLGSRTALAADAVTFLASAALVRGWVHARPAAAAGQARASHVQDIAAGVRLVFGDRALRTLMLLGWLAAFYTIPETLAVPYAAHLGGGPAAAGLVFAAGPAGAIIGVALLGRLVRPARRLAWMGTMATCCCVLLLGCLTRPGLAASLGLFTVSRVFSGYQMAANAAFVQAVPAARRGQAYGLASTGMQAGQGLAYVAAGALAQVLTPATVIALAGGLGTVAAIVLAITWARQHTTASTPVVTASSAPES